MTASKAQGAYDQILRQAKLAQGHMTRALGSLDKIIALATAAKAGEITKAANAAKVALTEKALAFNENVARATQDGVTDPTKVDLVVIDDADKAASAADAKIKELQVKLENLEKRVEKVEVLSKSNQEILNAFGFSLDNAEKGGTKPIKGTWADWTTTTVNQHQVDLHGVDGKSGVVGDVENLRKEVGDINGHLGRKVGSDGNITFTPLITTTGFNGFWAIIAFLAVMVLTILLGFNPMGWFAAVLLGLGLGAGAAWMTGTIMGGRKNQ